MVFILALAAVTAVRAEENCNAWRTADVDPSAGQFLIELRTCDLTYGISAYVQIRNSSDKRLALAYRIVTKDNKSRNDDIILEAASTTRAGNCQACASRYAGFKTWELLSVKVSEKPPEVKSETPAQPTVKLPSARPTLKEEQPVAAAPVEAPAPAKAVEVPKPVEPAVAPAVPSVNSSAIEPVPGQAANNPPPKEVDKKPKTFRAEDGTEIPYDQLPPEFRPRK